MAQKSEEKGRRGRPRSEAARKAILDAAYELVARDGYASVTTADIAERAGSGKQTIYRWWPSKAALVLDALQRWAETEIDPVLSGQSSLTGFFTKVCEGAARIGLVLRSLMAESQFDDVLRGELRARLIEPRRAVLRRALERHGVSDARDRETLVTALYGALWYRLLIDEPLDEKFIVDMVALADCVRADRSV